MKSARLVRNGRVAAADHRLGLVPLGAIPERRWATTNATPDGVKTGYGNHPTGAMAFLRLVID